MYISDYIKHCTPICTYSNQEIEEGGVFGGSYFDSNFFGGLLRSPLGAFCRLRRSLHPYLQVFSRSFHTSLQFDPSQILLLLSGGRDGGSVLLLCRDNLIDNTNELPITANLKQSEMR